MKDSERGVAPSLPYVRLISCRIAVANSDLAEHRVFLCKIFHRTVVEAVIYCMGSLANGAAGEERRVKELVKRHRAI